MRLTVLNPGVQVVVPGTTVTWRLEILNDGSVIEGVACSVPQLDSATVAARPLELPLFPGETGRVALAVDISTTFPAGRHVLTVVGRSTVSGDLQTTSLPIDVAPKVSATLAIVPRTVRARRRATYCLRYENTGNQAIPVLLSGADADRTMDYTFDETTFLVEPGQVVERTLSVRAPAQILGTENGRVFDVTADGGGLELKESGTLRHRPYLPRGFVTAFALLAIVGLWATAFIVGSRAAFGNDPLTKTAPASIYLSGQGQQLAADSDGAAAADAVPKQGPLGPGVGGTVTGAVRAVSTGRPVGRVVVSAWRTTKYGLRLVSSAASQSDGTYSLGGLYPGSYLIEFHATGFREIWFPNSAGSGSAVPVNADFGAVTRDIDTAISGLSGSLSGSIVTGATSSGATVMVTATSLLAAGSSPSVTVQARPSGQGTYSYDLADLRAPDQYSIRVTAAGYASSRTSDSVGGGEARSESTIVLSAASGQISGYVRAGAALVGGAAVSTTVNGVVVSASTPTTGAGVGSYTLANLPTPATYVLTVTADGYSGQPLPLQLAAGASDNGLTLPVTADTNTVTGQIDDASGTGIGGADVTVGGTAAALSTMSLTTASPGHAAGSFSLFGLPDAGSYTLTFSQDGYQPLTVPLTLVAGRNATPVRVSLKPSAGALTGQVFDPDGSPDTAAMITVTDGATVHMTTTTIMDTSGRSGTWTVTGLTPGTYTVSASAAGLASATEIVTVVAGTRPTVNLTLGSG